MTGLVRRRVMGDERNGLRLQLPVAWIRGANIRKGDTIELIFGGQVALLILKRGPESDRLLAAMREVR